MSTKVKLSMFELGVLKNITSASFRQKGCQIKDLRLIQKITEFIDEHIIPAPEKPKHEKPANGTQYTPEEAEAINIANKEHIKAMEVYNDTEKEVEFADSIFSQIKIIIQNFNGYTPDEPYRSKVLVLADKLSI